MGKLIVKREYDKHRAYPEADWTMAFEVNEDTTAQEAAEILHRVMQTMGYAHESIDKYFYYDWDDEDE